MSHRPSHPVPGGSPTASAGKTRKLYERPFGSRPMSSDLHIPRWDVPAEVAFTIPLYTALIIGFTRYWERIVAEMTLSRR